MLFSSDSFNFQAALSTFVVEEYQRLFNHFLTIILSACRAYVFRSKLYGASQKIINQKKVWQS